MKNEQILWAIGDIEDGLIFEALENSNGHTKKTIRPLKAALIVAAAMLLLAGTVAAAYQIHVWHSAMEAQYGPDEAQKEMADPSVGDVGASVSQDGCTYTIRQVLGDDYFMAVAMDVQLPKDGSAESALSGSARIDVLQITPTTATREEIVGALDEAGTEESAHMEDAALSFYLMHKVIREQCGTDWDGSYDGIGCGIMRQSYDPAANTLSMLVYAYTGSDTQMPGQDYTLVLDHLVLEDDGETELTQSPVVLNFKADYQPISQTYDILRDGEGVGTLCLSPVSMYLEFSVEQGRNHGRGLHRVVRDAFIHDNVPTVVMQDGTEAEFCEIGGGITEHMNIQLRATALLDISQVQEITWEGFTIVPK